MDAIYCRLFISILTLYTLYRKNSQKPANELYAAFKQTFPHVGPPTTFSSAASSESTIETSTSLSSASMDQTMDQRCDNQLSFAVFGARSCHPMVHIDHRVVVPLIVGHGLSNIMDQSTNDSLLPPAADNSATKTQIKNKTRVLESLINGDLPHPYLIPIHSPFLPTQPITPMNLARHPEAQTLSSPIIKQVTCTLQAWDFNWGRLFPSRFLRAKATQQPQ